MNKHESFAWLRFGLIGAVLVYLGWRLFGADANVGGDEWSEVRHNVSTVVYGLMFALYLFAQPGKDVFADERDKAISALAYKAALVALSLIVFVSAGMIGMDAYANLLTSRKGGWFEHYLTACVAFAWWIESAVCVFYHWRDRHGQ